MAYLFESPNRFGETIKDWYPYPARANILYPNRPSLSNPNFPVIHPPKPMRVLGINRTTAGSLIVAIEEYQSITWKFRPTAWPSMPHDKRQIADIKFHMAGLLQTMKAIIPNHLHEVPSPLKETMDCLAQSLIRLESINPDIRGQWRTFNDVSAHTSSNIYQEILNLTNMKLRQLKDGAIGETFKYPIEDAEALDAAAMIIESTAPRKGTATTETSAKRPLNFFGIPLSFSLFRRQKQKEPASESLPELLPEQEVSEALSELEPSPPTQTLPIPILDNRSPLREGWCYPSTPEEGSDTDFSEATEDSSYIAYRKPPPPIPGISYQMIDTPEIQSPVPEFDYSPISKNATVLPIRIKTPSSSPTHAAIREAAEEYRRKKTAEVPFLLRPRKRRLSPAAIARAAARRAAMGFFSAPKPSSGTNVGQTQHIENVGHPTEASTPEMPTRLQTLWPKPSDLQPTRVRFPGGDDENVPVAVPAGPRPSPVERGQSSFTRADFAKQVIVKTGDKPVSFLSFGA
ncbi:hypothetical protein TWF718_009344 [Orbilia javanica]|uniref:Uncharacterized protein n=1 Tax=Orbilia javanica TaxID=47235 RepID=A0AAN8MNE5_9PEZI